MDSDSDSSDSSFFLSSDGESISSVDSDDEQNNGAQPEDDEGPPPAIPLTQLETREMRDAVWGDVDQRVLNVLDSMAENGINVPIFMDALNWGTPVSYLNPVIRHARNVLLDSVELPNILERWWKPPRLPGSTNTRPRGARETMEKISLACIKEVVSEEMTALEGFLRTDSRPLVGNALTAIQLQNVANEMKEKTPVLWNILYNLAFTAKQERRETKKRPDKVSQSSQSALQHTLTK